MKVKFQSIILFALDLLLVAPGMSFAASTGVYLTAKDGPQRIERIGGCNFKSTAHPTEHEPCVFVDTTATFQTFVGIGGALTDASAETFYKLPKNKQQEILQAYFDPVRGIGYCLGRTHIHSCDFSSESYTYVNDGDVSLSSFDISHDRKYRIPFIKEVISTSGKDFKLFASPWSPPAWMKDNKDMLHGGRLDPKFYSAWASYFVKFVRAYEREGVKIWGLTVQNEPMASQTWESCLYTPEEERDFVKNDLGPALDHAGLGDTKLMIWDHNRNFMYRRAQVVLEDQAAAQYVWGLAFHWYSGNNFENVKRVKEAYPNLNLLLTEACLYPFDLNRINEWQWGEKYAISMINDFNNGAVGWTDWNVLLDQTGGPNHVNNFCYAPLHADIQTGRLYYMNSYYYIGHFSKFIRPGARRIISSASVDSLMTTAFLNQDGTIAVVVLNVSDQTQPFLLWLQGEGLKTESPSHSIMTCVFQGGGVIPPKAKGLGMHSN